MSKFWKVALVLLGIGALLIAPAVLGSIIYISGMGGMQTAMCAPSVSFWITCMTGTYGLLSAATGGIMWVTAIIIAAIGYIAKTIRGK